jgi:hypothetical protein
MSFAERKRYIGVVFFCVRLLCMLFLLLITLCISYNANNDDEHTFNAGDVFDVLSKDSDNWWTGMRRHPYSITMNCVRLLMCRFLRFCRHKLQRDTKAPLRCYRQTYVNLCWFALGGFDFVKRAVSQYVEEI